MDFNIPNDALIHWLRNTSGVWGEPSKSHVGKFGMGAACCVMQFGGNQASRTLGNSIGGWHVALSNNNKTCRFCIFILSLIAVNQSSMFCDVIHVFLSDLHSTGSFRMSMFRKHLGFAALPITKGFSTSPDIKPHRKNSAARWICR
jgi:hypothetical protein